MTTKAFFDAYKNGQRHFTGLVFEYEEGFSDQDFTDIIFENCFLYLNFRNSNLRNAAFISCNIKEIDLRGANLTDAVMTKCLVESALFKAAIVTNFRFTENYYYGHTLGQTDFDTRLMHSDADH